MTANHKVVWSEGMLLSPHHFQTQDRYYEALLSDRLAPLFPYGFGITALEIDPDGLLNQHFTLLRFKGILPDGLIINLPDADAEPEMRTISPFFPPTINQVDVFLGIPMARVPLCRLDGASTTRPTRYQAEQVSTPDGNTGENEREVQVAKKNLKIFFSGEETGDFLTLKIAELVRTAGGTIILKEDYVPPCLTTAASPYLTRLVRGLLELLSAKSDSLSGTKKGVLERGTSDAARFGLLQTINGTLPVLSHILRGGTTHPEQLYLALAQLAGTLTAFHLTASPGDIPSYDHYNLSKTFSEMIQKIRMMIEGVGAEEYVTIGLSMARPNVWAGKIADDRLLGSFQFYLAARGDLSSDQMQETIPRRIKTGAAEEIDLMVSSAMPGVRLYPVASPPTALPTREGRVLFRLEKQGPFWDSIVRNHTIAFYVPSDLKGFSVELMATKE